MIKEIKVDENYQTTKLFDSIKGWGYISNPL